MKAWIGRWLVGVVLMPASGFWLAFPPALAVRAGKGGARPAISNPAQT